ncbi:histidine kinase [Streptomyces blastmyceticus]|uniref:histidine kinase n=1 Tax=Streptomyces blastmyceticus TaxID=68180 RepID=A0ABN0WRB3_9ACTN
MRAVGGRGNARAIVRGLALFALGPVELVLFAAHLAAIAAACVGLVLLFPPVAERSRRLANLARRLAGEWCGVPVPLPYRPRPAPPIPGPDGIHRSLDGRRLFLTARMSGFERRSRWLWEDPATWRDVAWLLADPLVGGALAIVPAALICGGFWGALVYGAHGGDPLGWVTGAAGIVLGPVIAPRALWLHGAWTKLLLGPASATALARGRARRHWLGEGLLSTFRCLVLGVLSPLAAAQLAVCLLAFVLTGPLIAMRVAVWARWLPNLFRHKGREWSGLDLPEPYLPVLDGGGTGPEDERPATPSAWWAGFSSRARSLGYDPATWRDLLWLACQPIVGTVPLLLPVAMIGYGVWGLGLPAAEVPLGNSHSPWYGELFGSVWTALAGGVVLLFAGLSTAPVLLRLHSRWLPLLLRPTAGARLLVEREQLAARVERLTETRAAATDAQAAEVRRIERDLHDGAQARLVAIGISLGAVGALIDKDPEQAKRLVEQIRDSSAHALAELRGLIRGIHPPVLAERGLVDAIRALALDNPLDVRVDADLDGRAEPPVESAAYFAVAEVLTNATRHSGADRVRIELLHTGGLLRITVLDDGGGGADPGMGSGLRGIESRLGTFDGRLAISSPQGGPTTVTMELPCVLSSPRTSTSSGTA